MINSNKLIPRRSSGNSLNLTATSDLNVVRGTVVKIDNILKERLVLSKVREGIIRQQEERRIRSRRETLLERDDVKNNYSVDDEDKIKKPKSGLGGLLGSVFKGILGSLGSVAFGLTPSLLGVGLLVRKLTNPFLAITGVAFATLNVVVSKSGSQFKEIERKVNKSDISETKIVGGAQSVINELLKATGIFIGGTLAGRGVRRLLGGQLVTRRQAEEIGVKETIKKIKSGDVKSADRVIKNRGRVIQKTLFDSGYGSGSALAEVPNPAKIRGQFTMEGIKYPAYDSALSPAENMLRFINAEAGFVNKRVELETPGVKKVKVTQLDLSTELNKKIIKQRSLFEEGFINKTINQARELERRQAIATLKDMDLGDVQSALDDFPDDPRLAEAMADPDMALIEEMELGKKPPKKRTTPRMRREKIGRQLGLTRRFQRGMLRVSGRTFTKGVKSIIRNSLVGIPLIGDLIALLLDVFVFGEPVGRAAFMAVGSIIGGIIGGVAGLVAGPVGALIGGLVGSVGGDLLGAAFYDLIFRRGGVDVGSRFGNAITRGGIKAGVSGALEAGGFANYGKYLLGEAGTEFVLDADSTAAIEDKYPGFLMALNKSDGAGAIDLIREYASYETEGRVDFIPIPIPSVTNSDPQVIVINSQPKDKRLYSQHYRRG